MSPKSGFNLETCARSNILSLVPYRCARDDYEDNGKNILLDANENAYGSVISSYAADLLKDHGANGKFGLEKLHRYPDPHQIRLKQLLCNLRNSEASAESPPLEPANLFVGCGSDEAIDLLIRCFCVPSKDKILTCPPTYGMYAVSAHVNDVEVAHVPLNDDFSIDSPSISKKLSADPAVKLIYLCSPGNPTGQLLSPIAVEEVLSHASWNGVVVVDEAYIDFAPTGSSMAPLVAKYQNLVVMQTLSKAFGLAAIRLGAAFASADVARLLNAMKAPYNVSSITGILGETALMPDGLAEMRSKRDQILQQRNRLRDELAKIPGVGRLRGGQDANFLLIQMLDSPGGSPSNPVALAVYEQLAELKGIVVRFRGKERGCEGCVRITVGTEAEMGTLLAEIGGVLQRVWQKLDEAKAAEKDHGEAVNEIVA